MSSRDCTSIARVSVHPAPHTDLLILRWKLLFDDYASPRSRQTLYPTVKMGHTAVLKATARGRRLYSPPMLGCWIEVRLKLPFIPVISVRRPFPGAVMEKIDFNVGER